MTTSLWCAGTQQGYRGFPVGLNETWAGWVPCVAFLAPSVLDPPQLSTAHAGESKNFLSFVLMVSKAVKLVRGRQTAEEADTGNPHHPQ